MYDTIIIGAGLSGLAAGIRLAYYDQRVCILERHTTIGGLNSLYRLRGRNYDVGLHAVTNFTPKGTKRGPLAKLLRQLRFRWDDLALCPQIGSRIAFPGVSLKFTNDFDLFRSEVHRHFPEDRDGFERLLAEIIELEELADGLAGPSARTLLARHISNPLLREMILCPLMFYGSAQEDDMDFISFCVLFRSVYCEGFARPFAGIRPILKLLTRKFKSLGGELRLRAGVDRIATDEGRVVGVVLEDGTELPARRVLSSAGYCETLRLVECLPDPPPAASGQVSFVETISVLDCQPAELDHRDTICFFCDREQFEYRKPDSLIDIRSGIICSPNNFHYDEPLDEGQIRVTALASFDHWHGLTPEQYQLEKLRAYDAMQQAAVGHVPDYRGHTIETDVFTPTTIRRFTGHDNGAVYGTPQKVYDGTTPVEGLFLCGTDQGFLGIIGSILSGISMANRHGLADAR